MLLSLYKYIYIYIDCNVLGPGKSAIFAVIINYIPFIKLNLIK